MKKAAFYTLGCKVNQYETEAMTELFQKRGYEIVPFDGYADIYVINTCTVTGMSDRKSRQIIRRAKKSNPQALVAVTGCYAQTAPEDVMHIEGVNLIIGTKDRSRIVDEVEALNADEKRSLVGNIMDSHCFEEMTIETYQERTRAYIKVQEGCNQFCSYCIIPYARGPIRSRNPESVLAEVQKVAENGFSEVILVGIHIASYGLDTGTTSLSRLLNQVNAVEGIRRIRLSSIEPMTLNHEFTMAIKDCHKLCPHFHLSLQSGSDATLKRMNRKYTTAQYKEIVDSLRAHFQDAAVTTDIMVGFPGETEEEFQETARFVEEISFADAHIFKYSPRNGTPAAKRNDQIDPQIKEQRSKIIEEITRRSRELFLQAHIGKTMEVLFEQPYGESHFEGKTSNYITVAVKTDKDLSGQYHMVRLERLHKNTLFGTIVSDS